MTLETQQGTPTQNRILDAAYSLIVESGLPRTSIVAIAKRAKVSRPTVYRHWPDLTAIVTALTNRMTIEAIGRNGLTETSREELVKSIVSITVEVRDNDLFESIQKSDPKFFAQYMMFWFGPVRQSLYQLLTEKIRDCAQADSTLYAPIPEQLAAMILILAQGVIFSFPPSKETPFPLGLKPNLTRALNGLLSQ